MKLAERLEELKEEKNITHKQVALSIGINPSAYSKYVRGARQPDIETLIKIADYFEVTVDYLIGHEDKTYINKNILQEHLKDLESDLIKIKKYVNKTK
jgi:transcriptional regulator with XRE-family HTH domain